MLGARGARPPAPTQWQTRQATTPALPGAYTNAVRAYGLRSPKTLAVYLYHGACAECRAAGTNAVPLRHPWQHQRGDVKGLALTLDIPLDGTSYWYRPADARIIAAAAVQRGQRVLAVPPFDVDLALLVTAAGAPDSDGDGIDNAHDADNDNDGHPNAVDAFPLEPEEWQDADADRIGDSLDADLDGDGVADDRNGNGTPDCAEMDADGDGVPRAAAIPWDAFPFDPKEWRDSDGDGIGDNADLDDDGDGFSDADERAAGTDPLNAVSFPQTERAGTKATRGVAE